MLIGKIDLTDSLSAVYSLGEDVPSKFLEIMITSNQFQYEISEIVRKMYLGKDSLLSFRNLSIVIRYPSRSLALEGYQLFVGVLFGLEGVKSIDIVPISEHTTLECDWLSETSFSENVDRLKKAQQTLRGKQKTKLISAELS